MQGSLAFWLSLDLALFFHARQASSGLQQQTCFKDGRFIANAVGCVSFMNILYIG
jgi:hypothetical protein